MIQIEILSLESVAAILAGGFFAVENIGPGKFNFLLREMVVGHQEDETWHPDAERYSVNRFGMRFLLGEIVPLVEIISLERTVVTVEHNVSVALKQERQRPASSADVDRLPKTV